MVWLFTCLYCLSYDSRKVIPMLFFSNKLIKLHVSRAASHDLGANDFSIAGGSMPWSTHSQIYQVELIHKMVVMIAKTSCVKKNSEAVYTYKAIFKKDKTKFRIKINQMEHRYWSVK